jgi:hypothetical protein
MTDKKEHRELEERQESQWLLKRRCRILLAGGLEMSPSFKRPPRLVDIGD